MFQHHRLWCRTANAITRNGQMLYDSDNTPSGESSGSGWDDPSRMQPIREATHEYKVWLEIQRNRRRAERRMVYEAPTNPRRP